MKKFFFQIDLERAQGFDVNSFNTKVLQRVTQWPMFCNWSTCLNNTATNVSYYATHPVDRIWFLSDENLSTGHNWARGIYRFQVCETSKDALLINEIKVEDQKHESSIKSSVWATDCRCEVHMFTDGCLRAAFTRCLLRVGSRTEPLSAGISQHSLVRCRSTAVQHGRHLQRSPFKSQNK